MGKNTCCVVNCKNTGVNSKCKFYKFPRATHKLNQREKWIAAVKRVNSNESWLPKPSDQICSDHFIGNKKSDEELSPSYVPTKFSCEENVKNEIAALNRYNRFRKRRSTQSTVNTKKIKKSKQPVTHESMDLEINVFNDNSDEIHVNNDEERYIGQECQANIYFECYESSKSFTCNRYTNNTLYSDAEIQTEIFESTYPVKTLNRKRFKDKECNTESKTFIDQSVGCSLEINDLTKLKKFSGIESIKTDEDLLDLAGTTYENFELLLRRMTIEPTDNCKITKKNRLLIFLVKIKTGLTYSAMSVLFCVHRTTISRIFTSTLRNLSKSTADIVFWPNKDIVQGTMPKCFYPDYSNTRVIIDCTEFRIEVPESLDNRVFTFSHYKKGFTAKILIGITPGGFISFKSKVAGGRKSDSQITVESGLIDLLEDGDVVLADKGFPEIRKIMDKSGKNLVLAMPPFLENQSEFTQEQTEQTYSIGKVRIHVERIMQRLRTYQILNKISANLFNYIDDILHICCVLVNLQPPIHSDKEKKKNTAKVSNSD